MITPDRHYRLFEARASQENEDLIVEGYAVVFDEPTVLYSYDGIDYKEVIKKSAFDKCKMSDVVLNIDHGGKPIARTKNKTLSLTIDEKGLYIRANIGGTEAGRQAYEEVKGGYFDKMSFCFITKEDGGEEYDSQTHTRSITGIERLFDVSIVTFPAYDTTSVNARSFFEAEAEKEHLEKCKAEVEQKKRMLKRKKLALKIKLMKEV